jgi:hypothetical protein
LRKQVNSRAKGNKDGKIFTQRRKGAKVKTKPENLPTDERLSGIALQRKEERTADVSR